MTKCSSQGFDSRLDSGTTRASFWQAARRRGKRALISTLAPLQIDKPLRKGEDPKREKSSSLFRTDKSATMLMGSIGFLGHSGLLLASTVLVLLIKQLLATIQQARKGEDYATDESNGGMMDRCPWPFIFSHDPIQGLKDPPTWIVVTWIALWRITKIASRKSLTS
ncbi:expressed unknown protein [Seminavis robusta]|uniref:Uncharacterized protein n=1 Tax=Seminavis robusta TaxID=568900 RepID=A0A9N8ERY3_9STRA|nr:expressed unknown protein [Seminavis robusta]|eukprot:Sro1771_g296610.1 n/a (166) ;mRNA; f:5765-6262